MQYCELSHHNDRISCTVYCNCACGDDCFNPFKKTHEEEAEDGDEELRSASSDEE